MKKSTPHTMSTLHEEQHSDTEEELAAKSDDPVVTQKVESATSKNVTASQPDPENQNEFETNQVKNKINSFFHFSFYFCQSSFCKNNFRLSEQREKKLFYFKSFYDTFLLFQWQWRIVSIIFAFVFLNYFRSLLAKAKRILVT